MADTTTSISIVGDYHANVIYGGAGDDILSGAGGNDTLISGAGDDRLYGDSGADAMTGGAGNDLYYVDNAGDTVTELAAQGSDTVVSTIDFTLGANVERLVLTGSENLSGTGNSLNNKVTGNDGANLLDGGAGNDTLVGGGGGDILIGGAGHDTMAGGAGNDQFVFHNGDLGSDRITDFAPGRDTIDLSTVDANTRLSGDQHFSFIGTHAFTHTAGELHYEQVSGATHIEGDMNGDGVADFVISRWAAHVEQRGLRLLSDAGVLLARRSAAGGQCRSTCWRTRTGFRTCGLCLRRAALYPAELRVLGPRSLAGAAFSGKRVEDAAELLVELRPDRADDHADVPGGYRPAVARGRGLRRSDDVVAGQQVGRGHRQRLSHCPATDLPFAAPCQRPCRTFPRGDRRAAA